MSYVTQGWYEYISWEQVDLAASTDKTKCMLRSCQNNAGQNHKVRIANKSYERVEASDFGELH